MNELLNRMCYYRKVKISATGKLMYQCQFDRQEIQVYQHTQSTFFQDTKIKLFD